MKSSIHTVAILIAWNIALHIAYAAPADSLVELVLSPAPESLEMEATVMCSSVDAVTAPVGSRLLSLLSSSPKSKTEWRDSVSKMVRSLIQANESSARQVWHVRYMESENMRRIDTLENMFGDTFSKATFANPTETRIELGDQSGSNYTNYFITPQHKAIRLSKNPKSFVMIVPRQYLIEMPPTINAVARLVKAASGQLTFSETPLGEGLRLVEMTAESGPQQKRKDPLLKGIVDDGTGRWLGIFVFAADGTITSAAVAAGGLGLPIQTSTMFYDLLSAEKKVVTAVDPSKFALGAVSRSAFEVAFPTNWTVIDDNAGVATLGLGGKVIGQVNAPSGEPVQTIARKRWLVVLVIFVLLLPGAAWLGWHAVKRKS